MMWTHFHDIHSGGGQKLAWGHIFIEASEEEAAVVFQNRFGRNPRRVTCTCCGDDYSLSESETLEQATAYNRGCAYAYVDAEGREYPEGEAWVSGKGIVIPGVTGQYVERQGTKFSFSGTYRTLDEYLKSEDVCVIRKAEIKPNEYRGYLKEEGYVWRD